MLVASCNKEVLLGRYLQDEDGFRQFVLTDFGLVPPVPHEQALVVNVAKGYQEVVLGREND